MLITAKPTSMTPPTMKKLVASVLIEATTPMLVGVMAAAARLAVVRSAAPMP